MAVTYAEFQTTQANLLADVRAQILSNADWTRPNAASKPSLFKCTTTRGADMIVDLEDAAISLTNLNMAVYTAHDGTTGQNRSQRYLYWRGGGGATTNQLYVVMSLSKEHLYISIEGPRVADTGTENTTQGSMRQYFFIADLVPYHASDTTPVIVVGGKTTNSAYASVGSNDHQVNVSRTKAGLPWGQSKLATLDFPSMFTTDTVQTQRQSQFDGNFYLFPYVVISDEDGIRGRVNGIYFAGYNQTSDAPEVPAPPVNARVSYGGIWHKLLAANKGMGGNASQYIWGPLGASANSASSSGRSVVIAVPTV